MDEASPSLPVRVTLETVPADPLGEFKGVAMAEVFDFEPPWWVAGLRGPAVWGGGVGCWFVFWSAVVQYAGRFKGVTMAAVFDFEPPRQPSQA